MTHVHAGEILLVEDDPHDVELTLRALGQHNLANHVLVVDDGAQALDFVFARGEFEGRDPDNGPKVILLDLKLPKVDGFEVLRRIKSDATGRRTPVVVLTSSREERDIMESYDLGANSYLVKPVDFDEFIECVAGLGFYWLLCNEAPPPGTHGSGGNVRDG